MIAAVNLPAWNVGLCLASIALVCWWRSDGKRWWDLRGQTCRECGRQKASCSCVDVVFTASDVFDNDEEEGE